MSTNHDRLISEEIEQSERTRNEPLPADAPFTQPNRNPSSVLTSRLSSDLHDELIRLGKDLDVPPSTLARGFIAEGLAASEHNSVAAMLSKLESDLRRLRGLVIG